MAETSIAELLRQAAQAHPDRSALCFDRRFWTHAELQRMAAKDAGGLHACGVRRGDRVAFLLPNGPELVVLDLACLQLGAVAVPLNNRLKGPELAYILDHCQARVVVVHVDLLPSLEPVRTALTHVKRFFAVGDSPPKGYEPYENLPDDRPGPDDALPGPDDVAAILYTSGTTARPKGVTHTQRTLANTALHYVAAAGLTPDDVVLGMLSMSHIFGFTLQLLSPLSAGATVLIAPSFDALKVLDLVGRHRVTHLYGLPVMFDALSRQHWGRSADLGSLRYCLAGGDTVSVQLNERVRTGLGLELHEGCGMTEVIPYALNRPGIENRAGSIGPPSVGMNLRLVDEEGKDVAPGETGEIVVHSDALTIGYWEDPEATAQVLRDGWFHTGDLGRRDDAGHYWFVGRSKEIIVRGGSNVSPLEVEMVLAQHPAVHEAVVVGVPHPTLGEKVAAFIVLKKGMAATEAELRQFATQRIALYKVPEHVTFLDELPRGLTGKVQRRALRDLAAKT